MEMGIVSRLWLVPGLGGGGLKMAFEHSLYRLKVGRGFLAEASEDLQLKRWRSAVDNSQLAVENAAKAVLGGNCGQPTGRGST